MKKIIVAAFAIALPVIASAQVQLISGYNFGQFLGAGAPSLDGSTGDPVGSVGSNFRLTNQAPGSSSGDIVGNTSSTGDYSNGFGRAYWNGTNGSTAYDYTQDSNIGAVDVGFSNAINGQTVNGYSMASQGDNLNNGLITKVNGGKIAFVQNTLGFLDYDHTAFANGLNVASDQNLTFSASVSSPVTINWFLNGSNVSFGSTALSGGWASYSVDLAASFYNISGATVVAEFVGAGFTSLDNVQFNGVAIPEPSTYAMILGAFTLGFAALRRKKANVIA